MENQNNLVLNEQAVDALKVSAKWTMFLSIIGFISLAFMVLMGLFTSFAFTSMTHELSDINPFFPEYIHIRIFYILFGIIYFFPIYYLYKYSKGIKDALSFRNSDLLSEALVNLKSHHKFLGIMTIVMISLYILIFIGTMLFFASTAASQF